MKAAPNITADRELIRRGAELMREGNTAEYSKGYAAGYEAASVNVRQALRKILAPWIGGNIGFDEWCIEVDRCFPDHNVELDEL